MADRQEIFCRSRKRKKVIASRKLRIAPGLDRVSPDAEHLLEDLVSVLAEVRQPLPRT